MQDMSKQEATRLADALENSPLTAGLPHSHQAAALLRRWPDGEPVATLHDDGCFTWKRDEFRRKYDRQHAGWRMDVYAAPPDRPVPVGPIYCVGNKVSHAYFWRRSDADAFAASAGAAVGLHVWEVQVMGRPPDQSERIAAPTSAQFDDVAWLWTHCRSLGMQKKSLSGSMRDDVGLFARDQNDRIAALEAEKQANYEHWRNAEIDLERHRAALKVAREALEGWRSVDVHSALTEDEADAIKAKDDAARAALEHHARVMRNELVSATTDQTIRDAAAGFATWLEIKAKEIAP